MLHRATVSFRLKMCIILKEAGILRDNGFIKINWQNKTQPGIYHRLRSQG